MNGMKRALLTGPCLLTLAAGANAQQLGVGPAVPGLSTVYPVVTVSGTTPTVSSCCGAIMTTLGGTISTASVGSGDNGPASSAVLTTGIRDIAVDAAGDVFFSDITSETIRVIYEGGATAASLIKAENSNVTTPVVGDIYVLVGAEGVAGSPTANGEFGTTARLTMVTGAVSLDAAGDVYFYESVSNKVWVLYAGGTTATNLIKAAAPGTTPVLGAVYAIAGSNPTKGYSAYNNVPATSSTVQFYYIDDIKFDALGNMYLVDNGAACIREVTASNGNILNFAGTPGTPGNGLPVVSGVSTPVPATTAALSGPYGIAVSPSGDVYIADEGNYEIKVVYSGVTGTPTAALIKLENPTLTSLTAGYMYMIAGSGSLKPEGFGYLATRTSIPHPTMVALDNAGDLYIAATYIEEVNVNTGYLVTVASNGTLGLAGDGGLATSAEMQTVRGVAVDAAGRIYTTDYGNARIREVSQGLMVFTGEPVGTTSAPELILLTNTGDATLTFSGTPTFGGTNGSDYALDSSFAIASGSTTYEAEFLSSQTPTVCTSPSSLAAGASCLLPVTYTPTVTGPTTATLSIPTNDSLSPQIINLEGLLTPTSVDLVGSATTSYPGGVITLTATVEALGGSPTGTVSIYAGSITTGTPLQTATLPASATLTLSGLSPGTHTYTAVYTGDTNFAASTSALLTINADNFTLSATPTTLSVAPGAETPVTLTVVGSGPSAQTLSLSCTAPGILGCAFFAPNATYSTSLISFAAGATTVLTLQVAAVPTTSMRSVADPSKAFAATLLPLGALLAFGLGARRRSKVRLPAFLLWVGSLGMLSGCTELSNIGTPLGASTQSVIVNVSSSGTSTTYTQSVTLTVNVQ